MEGESRVCILEGEREQEEILPVRVEVNTALGEFDRARILSILMP